MSKEEPEKGFAAALNRAGGAGVRLHRSTNNLNEGLAVTEAAIVQLGLGVQGWVLFPLPEDHPEWSRTLGFRRFGDTWRLVVTEGPGGGDPEEFDTKPLVNCSRQLRLAAVDLIPELVEDMVATAESEAAEADRKVDALRSLVVQLANKAVKS